MKESEKNGIADGSHPKCFYRIWTKNISSGYHSKCFK